MNKILFFILKQNSWNVSFFVVCVVVFTAIYGNLYQMLSKYKLLFLKTKWQIIVVLNMIGTWRRVIVRNVQMYVIWIRNMKLLSNLGNIDKIHLNWSIRYFTSIYGYIVVIYTSSLKTLPIVNRVWNHNVPAPVSSSIQRLIS